MGLSNNDIFKKLRVAHKLRDEDIVDICKLVNFTITKAELGSFFRNDDNPKFVKCGDQILRNFLDGLIVHLRGPMPDKREGKASTTTAKPKQKMFAKPKPPFKPRTKDEKENRQ